MSSRYGRSRLFDDQDEQEEDSFGRGGRRERAGGNTRSKGVFDDEDEQESSSGIGGGRKKNPFDDDADDNLLRMQAQISHHEDACLESTKRALASIADSERTGVATAEELVAQREQLERVDQRLDETQTTLKASQRSLNGIKSVWGGLTNMFKKKEALIPPSPVKSQPMPPSRLKGVVNDLDNEDDFRPGSARVTTKRGVDVGGFFDDVDEGTAKTVSRSSTVSSGFSQTRQANSARMQEVDDNLDLMSEGLGRLKNLAVGLNDEIETQNDLLDRINDKVMDTDDTLWHQQKQIKRILK